MISRFTIVIEITLCGITVLQWLERKSHYRKLIRTKKHEWMAQDEGIAKPQKNN